MRASIAARGGAIAVLAWLAAGPAIAQAPPTAPVMRALTQPQDDYPDISPDGRRIVFQSNRSGSWQLWLMNRDGTGLERLTTGGGNDRTPAWSPDGTKIAYSSDRTDGPAAPAGSRLEPRSLFLLDMTGELSTAEARRVRLTAEGRQDIHPKWAEGGRRIVFNRVRPGNDGAEVMSVDAGGGAPRPIALAEGWNTYASLTPDARRLVYRGTTREAEGARTVENSDIFTAAADGTDRRRLTDDAAFDGWPAVSPDGRTIAFASRRAGERFHIYLMPLEGGTPRQITFGDHHHTQPAWAPDGRALAAYRWTLDRGAEVGHLVWLDLAEPAHG